MAEPVIQVNDLKKIYPLYDTPLDRLKEALNPFKKKYHRDFYALQGVSFDVNPGETLGVIGRNGSGKSTLLKILTGVLTPTKGQVFVRGRVLALLELGAGFNPELTGLENIFFYGVLCGASRDEMKEKLSSILEFADIGSFISQPIRTYSSGMVVRLAFAVIANMNADVLIIDEALAVGDAFFVQKCMRFLRSFKEKGTLLFVSHDSAAIVSLCSRVIWLQEGGVKMDGPPKEVAEAYLADLYEERQGKKRGGGENISKSEPQKKAIEYRDMREDFINDHGQRNEIEVFVFSKKSEGFGHGGAEILNVFLLDSSEHPLCWCVGGEKVILKIICKSYLEIEKPIVGFVVKDRLGQVLFADNTYLYCLNSYLTLGRSSYFEAIFSFRMPVLPCGDYSISVAVADGTQEDHVQHQWLDDAMIFRVQSSHVCHGLIGIPMEEVILRNVSTV